MAYIWIKEVNYLQAKETVLFSKLEIRDSFYEAVWAYQPLYKEEIKMTVQNNLQVNMVSASGFQFHTALFFEDQVASQSREGENN